MTLCMLRISYIFFSVIYTGVNNRRSSFGEGQRFMGLVFLNNYHICYPEMPWLFTNVVVQATVNNHGRLEM